MRDSFGGTVLRIEYVSSSLPIHSFELTSTNDCSQAVAFIFAHFDLMKRNDCRSKLLDLELGQPWLLLAKRAKYHLTLRSFSAVQAGILNCQNRRPLQLCDSVDG